MFRKLSAACLMSLGAAFAFASGQAFGGPAGAQGGGAASARSGWRAPVHRPLHRHGRYTGALVPAAGGYVLEAPAGRPVIDVPPLSADVTYTYKYDVPWDWAHRYPPSFFAGPPHLAPPPLPFEPGCPTQLVTVPGGDGGERTIAIARC